MHQIYLFVKDDAYSLLYIFFAVHTMSPVVINASQSFLWAVLKEDLICLLITQKQNSAEN